MIKRYIIRQFQDDKKHYYFNDYGITPFSIRIDDSCLFADEGEARKRREILMNEYEDLEVIAVKVKVSPVRAK